MLKKEETVSDESSDEEDVQQSNKTNMEGLENIFGTGGGDSDDDYD